MRIPMIAVVIIFAGNICATGPKIVSVTGNPFSPGEGGLCKVTHIVCDNPDKRKLTVEIFDWTGGSIRGFSLNIGNPMVIWDGRDISGNIVPPDLYYVTLSDDETSYDRAFLLVGIGKLGDEITRFMSRLPPGRTVVSPDVMCFPDSAPTTATTTITIVNPELKTGEGVITGGTKITAAVKPAKAGKFTLKVMEQSGNIIWQNSRELAENSTALMIWDGGDLTGKQVDDGFYIVNLSGPEFELVKTVELRR